MRAYALYEEGITKRMLRVKNWRRELYYPYRKSTHSNPDPTRYGKGSMGQAIHSFVYHNLLRVTAVRVPAKGVPGWKGRKDQSY